jgi:glucosamine--fructose-6-phosphate aminotransferase (isomerizing)
MLSVYNSEQKISLDIRFETSNIELNNIAKGKYSHFMEKEIFEQPISIQNTLKDYINYKTQIINFDGLSNTIINRILNSSKILFIACGTSLNACIATYSFIENLLNIPTNYENACSIVERNAIINKNDAYIFVSQSGETSDTLQSLRYIKNKGGYCIGITNVCGSTLSRETDYCIYLNAGCEIGVGSTKAYTSQVTIINLFILGLYQNINANAVINVETVNHDILNIYSLFEPLPTMIQNLLEIHAPIYKNLVKTLKNEKHILFIGRGNNYATALECSLKFKEIPYIHSEAILASELKHGPLALIDDNVLSIIFATDSDELQSKNLSTINQLKSRNARMIVVCNSNNTGDFIGLNTLVVFKVHKYLQPIINIIPFQLLAYYIAVEKGYNVDQPRNLAKSVTVSD